MFSELPKILDRDFAIAYFLPALAFLGAHLILFTGFGLFPQLVPPLRGEALKETTLLGVVGWLLAILLLMLNYSIYRLIEGYGKNNPAQLFKARQLRRYQRLRKAIDKYDAQIEYGEILNEDKAILDGLGATRDQLQRKLVESYPLEEYRLLPTAFGNTVRAFEDYPHDVYRVDSIQVWVRLIGVMPKEYRGLIGAAKAETDFWVNLWFLSFLSAVEYFCLVLFYRRLPTPWFPLLAIVITFLAASRARSAAVEWGVHVKAAFDLFLPKLRATLQFAQPPDLKGERRMWDRFSQVVLYHDAELLPKRIVKAESDSQQSSEDSAEAAAD